MWKYLTVRMNDVQTRGPKSTFQDYIFTFFSVLILWKILYANTREREESTHTWFEKTGAKRQVSLIP